MQRMLRMNLIYAYGRQAEEHALAAVSDYDSGDVCHGKLTY
jgi:hypothetical protein